MNKQAEKVGTEKLVRVDVVFMEDGDVKVTKKKAVIEGYTDKNIKLGENRGDLKRFINRDLVGELLNLEDSAYSKWIVVGNETELKMEIRSMILEIAKLVRAEESEIVNYYLELKRNLREEGKKYIVEPVRNPDERRGRPKGAKNKPKYRAEDIEGTDYDEEEEIKNVEEKYDKQNNVEDNEPEKEQENEEEELDIKDVVKRRGRPKGSKNKVHGNVDNDESNDEETNEDNHVEVKRRGRPKGSRNKNGNNEDELVQSGADVFEAKASMKGTGKRGRPKGAKNKQKNGNGNEDIPFVEEMESV